MTNVITKIRSFLTAAVAFLTVLLSYLQAACIPAPEEEKLDRDLKRVQQRAARIQKRNNAAAEAHERTIEALQSRIVRLDEGYTKAEITELGVRRLLGEE